MSFLGVCALSHLFQVIVSQPVFPAGSRAKLSCHSVVDPVYWYRQRQRSDMKRIYTASKYFSAVGRFSSEFSDEAHYSSLLIADTRRNDSGMYYCAIRNSQTMTLIFGNGSQFSANCHLHFPAIREFVGGGASPSVDDPCGREKEMQEPADRDIDGTDHFTRTTMNIFYNFRKVYNTILAAFGVPECHSECIVHTSFRPKGERVLYEIRIGGSETDRLKSRAMSFLAVCALSHLFQVIMSQPVLYQSPPVQTLPAGSPAKLSCLAEGSVVGFVFWYRQSERNDMKLVYRAGQYIPAEGRFSSETSCKAGNCSLLIADTRRDDSGMYYCAIRNFKNMARIFGNGSQLVITEGSPTIFLLTPLEDEIPSMERVPLLCLIRGLSPDSFTVHWDVSGRDADGQTDSGRIETDGTYTIRSYTSLSAETWSSGALCTCAVQINSSENLLSASVSSQRVSPLFTNCSFVLSGGLSAAALLLLGMILVAGRRSCRIRQTGKINSDEEMKDCREQRENKETLYARLAFNEDPIL
ncbi:uncharacterized protein LOC144672194 [Cetorhinus maximus]